VIDSDDLIVEAIEEEYPNFQGYCYSDPREVISQFFRYIHFSRGQMNNIYEIAIRKMRFHRSQNRVVLLGTKDLMHIADRICIQKDDDIVRSGFNSDNETDKLDNVLHGDDEDYNVHYIHDYLDGCLQKICKGRL
jgi:uncharacterized protein YecE (DUF72 family)